MKARFYLVGLLLVVSAFMTAFVITAQEDAGGAAKPATAPAAGVVTPAPVPTPAPAAPEATAAKADKPPSTPIVIQETKKDEGEGFSEVISSKGEVKGAKITASKTAENLISITLDDVEMIDVARMFTKIANANILYNPTNLRGRVTVNLVDVEWKPALETILEMHGLALKETLPGTAVYSIAVKPPGQPEPLRVETYFLKYATVAEVVGLLTPMVGQGGSVLPFPSRNALVVRSTAANQGEIKGVIEKVDKLREQVFIEAKFMELSDQAIKDLGVDWQSLQSYKLGVGSMNWSVSESRKWANNRSDTQNQWDHRGNLDQVNNNYDLNGQPYEVTTSTDRESPPGSGHYVTDTVITPTRLVTDKIDLGKNIDQSIGATFNKDITDLRTAVLSAADFGILLSALKQQNGVSIVSNPKIIVANEQPALIHIGQRERPFISTITPATTTTGPLVTYNPGEPLDTGVKLTVTPTVNTMSNITVKIEPELTRFVRDATAPNGQTYPIISTKRISTIFCLENGKTVAIGGLTETQDREQESKIPLLGDIPIIGKYLFSHSHTEKSQTETIIFVTIGLAVPETLQKESGLPENTQIAQQQMLSSELQKRKFQADMEEIKKNLDDKKDRDVTVRSRLLRQRI